MRVWDWDTNEPVRRGDEHEALQRGVNLRFQQRDRSRYATLSMQAGTITLRLSRIGVPRDTTVNFGASEWAVARAMAAAWVKG